MVLRIKELRLLKGGFAVSASFEIDEGAQIAIIGPSGAGKSTLFDALAGFLKPVSGTIHWRDLALDALTPGKRPIAMLFQDNNLFPHMNVTQNIGLALTQKRRLNADQKAKISRVLARVGLDGLEDRRVSELSGGQISRVALARLLLQDRPVWLLDEPFSALGPGLKAEMLALVAETASESNATVLMITHDPKDAARFADSSLLVVDGEVQGPFETQDLLSNPPDALKRYLGT